MTIVTAPGNTALLWVCTDCYFAHHGTLEDPPTDREPLSRIPAHLEVSAGMFHDQHASDCDYAKYGTDTDPGYECECELTTFSKSPCDGCGSHLAGARFALTLWYPCQANGAGHTPRRPPWSSASPRT